MALGYSTLKHRFGITLFSLMPLAAVINIGLIISILYKKKHCSKSHQIVILNLAVTDLILAVFGVLVRGPGMATAACNPMITGLSFM